MRYVIASLVLILASPVWASDDEFQFDPFASFSSGEYLPSEDEDSDNLTPERALEREQANILIEPEDITTYRCGVGFESDLPDLPQELTRFTRLTCLDAEELGLEQFPKVILDLTTLTDLGLNDNAIISIPTGISQLVCLHKLFLSDNELTELPEELCLLQALTELDLEDNHLTTLPKNFSSLTSLTSLVLSGNKIKSLSQGFEGIPLKQLSLNGLGMALEAWDRLPLTIEWLNASHMDLEIIPSRILLLTRLTELHIEDNGISEIPEGFLALTLLQRLDLSRNRLTAIPRGIRALVNLEHLCLSGNALTALPKELNALTKLDNLDIGNNPIQRLPSSIVESLKRGEPVDLFPFFSDGRIPEQVKETTMTLAIRDHMKRKTNHYGRTY